MTYPNNAEYLNGHDFSHDPIKATEAAIRDVLIHGAGVIENAFDQDKLNKEYRQRKKSLPDSRIEFGMHPTEYLDVIDAISKVTRRHTRSGIPTIGDTITNKTFVATVSPNDPWHQDGSRTEPGFRLISQLSGPPSGLVVVDKNENMSPTDTSRHTPKPEAGFAVAKYAMDSGTVVLLSESHTKGLRVASTDEDGHTGLFSLESPFHAGRLESDDEDKDHNRRIVVSHVDLLPGTYIDDLGVTPSKLRGASPLDNSY